MTPVVAIVGYANSGKTTLVAALLRLLSAWGYRVAAIKHCHEGHQFDATGKDTGRLLEAGAAAVIASSPGLVTMVRRTEGDAALKDLVASLDDYDLVLAEGFKGSSAPKVLVVLYPGTVPIVTNVIAVVSDVPVAHAAPHYRPTEVLPLAEYLLARFALGHAHGVGGGRPC